MSDSSSRESLISTAFVAVADTLNTDFDAVDLLHTLVLQCTSILDTDEGGLMLVDGAGRLQLMTSTNEAADFVEVMQLDADAGPCIDCFTSGAVVSVSDVESSHAWPDFRRVAVQNGFRSAHAIPLKLRGQVIGTMNLFARRPGELNPRDAAVGQALADVATIAILQERVARESTVVADQIHRALDSRILVEQAKGVIAHSLTIKIDEAFDFLRRYARANNLTIRTVAEGVSDRTIKVHSLISADENSRNRELR